MLFVLSFESFEKGFLIERDDDMILSCKNCGARIVYDPKINRMRCDYCDSTFDVSEYQVKPGYHEEGPVLESEIYGGDQEDMECQIYRCSACGAEISVNSVEASTFCVYCGSPNVVFSRVAKVKKPKKILPFMITKQQAEMLIRKKLNSGFFIPDEIKNFHTEMLRGIYIPYYITNVAYRDSMVVKSEVGSGKSKHTTYSLRSGYCIFDRMTTDASRKLSDDTSVKLEPYNMTSLRDFNVNYLTGFYSDVTDVDPREACNTATNRSKVLFNEAVFESVRGSSKEIVSQNPEFVVKQEPMKAMLPAWFLTFRYNNRPYTILVNGQTGKVVGGVPWNKARFIAVVSILALIITILAMTIFGALLLNSGAYSSSSSSSSTGKLIVSIIIGSFMALGAGIQKLKKVLNAIRLTTESSLTSYVSKRQNGG